MEEKELTVVISIEKKHWSTFSKIFSVITMPQIVIEMREVSDFLIRLFACFPISMWLSWKKPKIVVNIPQKNFQESHFREITSSLLLLKQKTKSKTLIAFTIICNNY